MKLINQYTGDEVRNIYQTITSTFNFFKCKNVIIKCVHLMLASHCPEVDTRWPYEYVILNFARRWPRTWSKANQQPKQVRCLQKVTRWHPNHTRRQHEDVNFYSSLYPQDTRKATRMPHDGYTFVCFRNILG